MASTLTEEVVPGLKPGATEVVHGANHDNNKTYVKNSESPTENDSLHTDKKQKSLSPDADSKGRASTPDEPVVERQIVDSSYVGWKQMGGWQEKDKLTTDDMLLDTYHETFLEDYLPSAAYGDWYHSTAIFAIGGILSFLLGSFKFSLAPVFFVTVLVSVYYRSSIKKYRGTLRDLVQKEMTVQKVENDYESMEWLNSFLDKYWPQLEPSVSHMVVEQANREMAKNPSVPGFISALWIDQFTLGVKPPRIDLVKTFKTTPTDVAVMDWGLSFTPHDLCDLDEKQLKNYVNQKVVVKAKIFGITIPVVVTNIAFRAVVRVRMKMRTAFPHVETVNIQLLDIPDVDFVFKLFGDSIFNWEIMAIPGLLPFVREMARKYAGPMVLPPFSFQLNVPQLLSGSALSIGVLELHVKGANSLRFSKSVHDSEANEINPYLEFAFNDKVAAVTGVAQGSVNPVWNESILILLQSFTDPLSITLLNKRGKFNDKMLGRIQYNLSSLHERGTQTNLSTKFLLNSKPVGELHFDMKFHPTLEAKKLPDGTTEDVPDLNTGITKIVIEGARRLDFDKNKVSSLVEMYINTKLVASSSLVKKDNSPSYNCEHEAIITDRRKTRVKLVVKNNKGEILSSTLQSLNDLIDRGHIEDKWLPLANGKGELKVTTHWKPIELGLKNDSGYTPPIGVIRLFLNKAEDLRNLERIGKIDPYARVLVNGIVKGRTDAKDSTLNPIWNEAVYVPITSPHQRITIECMDVETAGKDRNLGKFDIKVTELFKKGPDDKYVEIIDEEPKVGRLVSKKGVKGTVTYYTSFYPALPVLSLEETLAVDAINDRKIRVQNAKTANAQLTSEQKKELDTEETEIQEMEELYSNKMKLDLDELLQYNSGVFSFTILGGELPQPSCCVQAFFDSNGHASYVSPVFSTKTIRSGTAGECMIRESQWSTATFRISKNPYQNKAEEPICEVSIPTYELIKNCYYKPSILTLEGQSKNGKLMLQTSWFPIVISRLPEVDMITNTGDLKIAIHSASALLPADRNGKSDPYVKFFLDDSDELIYKTKTKKKTLNPIWDEVTTIEIHNRVNNYLRVSVMDWDAGNSDDLIGTATISLADIDPDGETFMDVPLLGPEGEDGGILHLRFMFAPRYTMSVNRVETKVGDLATKGLSAGIHAGTSVIGGGLGAVSKLKKGIMGKKKDKETVPHEA
ncbi:HEL277Cp [Eremothecium sinecaudum]|uniref:HEL277Cp n=1 Tax=Eremothecium sinecaudum TaxID=45286 RepID=A0A0X8HT69_9SACH|nr:HEL277Cp [Eremothecium sinecaudum]AMD21004.1 HEL277Cp [Eremothecium sinecaudum]